MKTCVNLHAGLFAAAILVAGCGPNLTAVPPSPATGPTTLEPLLLPQLDGVWGGEMTLTLPTSFVAPPTGGGTGPAVNAGFHACGGSAFINVLGETNENFLSIKQDGRDLEARLASRGTGLACTYTGRVGSNGAVVLDAQECVTPLTLRCANGDVVSLEFMSSTITATTDAPVQVTSIRDGRVAFTYNIGQTNDQGLVAHHTFTALTRR